MIGHQLTVLVAVGVTHLDLAVLAPVILLSVALLIYCLADLIRRPRVTGGNKLVWAAVIVVLGTIGQVVYLVLGREEG